MGRIMECSYKSKSVVLAQRLHQELLKRRLPAHSAVPSVRALASRYGISTVTADRILDILASQGFIYRVPRSGSFIQHDPPALPQIAYIGSPPGPNSDQHLFAYAFRNMLEYLDSRDCPLSYISYHELQNPALAQAKLCNLNGILLEGSYLDQLTQKSLRGFSGKIVMVGLSYVRQDLSCSQIVPDFSCGLLELTRTFDLHYYKRIIVLHPTHSNGKAMLKELLEFFDKQGVSSSCLQFIEFNVSGNSNAEAMAEQYFSQNKLGSCRRTLMVSLSDYFLFGMEKALPEPKKRPDLFSIDNVEGVLPEDTPRKKCITSIDKSITRCYVDAAELLLRMIEQADERNYIIKVPTKLLRRGSMKAPTPKPHNDLAMAGESPKSD